MSTTKSSSSQVTKLSNTNNRVLPRHSGKAKTDKPANESKTDQADNEGYFLTY